MNTADVSKYGIGTCLKGYNNFIKTKYYVKFRLIIILIGSFKNAKKILIISELRFKCQTMPCCMIIVEC